MEKRAILFGMFHYTNNRSISADELPSTAFDVMILEKKLKQLQFKTSSYIDLGLKDVEQKILEFATTAPCDSLQIPFPFPGFAKCNIFFWTWRTQQGRKLFIPS